MVRLYVAITVDGYIARKDGRVDFLDVYNPNDFGFQRFLAQVGIIIMGRASYDQAAAFADWPYVGKRIVVLTHRPLAVTKPGVECYSGDLRSLIANLRCDTTQDIWVFGGARVARDMLDANLIDQIELFVIPLLLGEGKPLFPPSAKPTRLRLDRTERYSPSGVVELVYRRIAP